MQQPAEPRTADGQHVVRRVDVEGGPQLAEGAGAVVLPLEVGRWVRRRRPAAVTREVLLRLRLAGHAAALSILTCSDLPARANALSSGAEPSVDCHSTCARVKLL